MYNTSIGGIFMKTSNTSKRLKEIMDTRGLKQVDILEMAKPYCQKYGIRLGRNDLSQYVSGKVTPGQEKLTILGLALGVTETWLMGYDVPMERDNNEKINSLPHHDFKPVSKRKYKYLGEIACGEPIFADEQYETYIELDSDIHADFVLRAKGDSMINAGIHDGDLLLIRQQNDIDNGDIAVVAVNGDDATLKRVKKQKNAIILQPENPTCETMIFVGKDMEKISIRGRLMQLRKSF